MSRYHPQWCPCCQSSKIEVEEAKAFVEAGDYNPEEQQFEGEWYGAQYVCTTCQAEFVI